MYLHNLFRFCHSSTILCKMLCHICETTHGVIYHLFEHVQGMYLKKVVDSKNIMLPSLCQQVPNHVNSYFRLLASLSGYQYTRKSWKKEGMELLLDSQFFQMDLPSLQHWRCTVDNLMTHDKTTFKELMGMNK